MDEKEQQAAAKQPEAELLPEPEQAGAAEEAGAPGQPSEEAVAEWADDGGAPPEAPKLEQAGAAEEAGAPEQPSEEAVAEWADDGGAPRETPEPEQTGAAEEAGAPGQPSEEAVAEWADDGGAPRETPEPEQAGAAEEAGAPGQPSEEAVAEWADDGGAPRETPEPEQAGAAEEAGAPGQPSEEAVAEWADDGGAPPEAPQAADGELADEVQVSLSAEQLLGEQEQPADAADTQAAELKAVLEAIIYLLNEPMPVAQIAQALGRDVKEVEPVLRQLAEESHRPDRGIFFREVAGGYQMATKPEHHEVLRNFVQNLKQPLKLSQAALETLAVIAYKQPITMPEILEIRGVQGGGVVKTLIDRKLITTAGRKNVIGKPMLYKTTKEFLTQFGLRDVQELPSLKEFEEIRRQSMADDEIEVPAQATLEPQPEPEPELPLEAVTEPETVLEPEPVAEPPKEENA